MELTIIRGIPGSGKTTYAKKIEALHLENDMFCMVDGEYCFDFDKIKKRANLCLKMAKQALASGCDCVVSNTFTQLWEIEPYLEIAEKYKAKVKVITMKKKYKNIHGVPSFAIDRMISRWEDYPNEKIIK